jgi:hypothetical protein
MTEFWKCTEYGPLLIHESEVIEKYNLFFRRVVFTDSIGIEHSYDTEVFKTQNEAWKSIIQNSESNLKDCSKRHNDILMRAVADGYKI